MKRFLFLTVFLLTAVALYTNAHWDRIRGSGPIETEVRALPAITGIRLEGSTNVYISHSTEQEVSVKAYANLLPVLETKMEGETLVIGFKRGTNVTNSNAVVYLKLPSVKRIAVSGSGNVEMAGPFREPNLEVSVSGSSDVLLNGGSATNYAVQISGSGNVSGPNFKTENAAVNISGSGNVKVHAVQSLKANVAGSGNVYYTGTPATVKSNLAGSGRLLPQ